MKIFSGCLVTETNTFSPIPTGLEDFIQIRTDDITTGTHNLNDIPPFDVWQSKARARGDDFIFSSFAYAQPAGLTTRLAYEHLRDELLNHLRDSGPVDIVLLFLHGAMMAQGYDDCEGDMLVRARKIVGPDVTIAVELDLHCHLTQQMIRSATLMNTFKEYPHVDVSARGKELFDMAIDAHMGNTKPTMALFDCKMVGMYPTTAPDMRGFVDTMMETETKKGVLSVSFGHGFPFGDIPDEGGKMLVVTDNDKPLAESIAKELGLQVFGLRHRIGFDSLPMEEALSKAVTLAETNTRPVVIADQSDNPGGGAPGDSTFALRWLLENKIQDAAIAIIYDPQTVKFAKTAGVGAELSVRLGGKTGPTSGDPLDLDVTVKAVALAYKHRFPQEQGKPALFPLGDTVAIHCSGIDIIVSSIRGQCFSPCIFDDLGIPVKEKKLLIIKSAQHFYGAFAPIASEVIYMAAPGAVPPIMQQVPYKRMTTADKYPWVDNPFLL